MNLRTVFNGHFWHWLAGVEALVIVAMVLQYVVIGRTVVTQSELSEHEKKVLAHVNQRVDVSHERALALTERNSESIHGLSEAILRLVEQMTANAIVSSDLRALMAGISERLNALDKRLDRFEDSGT